MFDRVFDQVGSGGSGYIKKEIGLVVGFGPCLGFGLRCYVDLVVLFVKVLVLVIQGPLM